jgi:ParB/RepB/Spo0J family partition protein
MTAATAATAEELQSIPLELIDVLPNTRKVYNQAKLDELAESFRKFGQLQPVLVRPGKAGRFELVYGTRRRLSAGIAKLPTLLARVRQLTDEEVLEIQIIENAQREDITPLEEAEAYRELHERFKRSADHIAAKIGKSREYVYARIKLCSLTPESRKALAEGKLSPSTALLVARIPVAALQKQATKELTSGGGEPISAREAAKHVQSRYMLKLADAPFDQAEVVAGSTACSGCPKNTGNQKELFKDVKGDHCTDPECWGRKREAAWKRKASEAKVKGQVVLSEKETNKLFPGGMRLTHNSDYIELDETCYVDPKQRTNRQLLAKQMPPVTLARTEDGKVHELVGIDAANKAMKVLHTFAKTKLSSRPKDEVEREKKAKVLRETQRGAIAEIVKRAEARQPDEKWARVFVDALIDLASNETVQFILKRRGLVVPKKARATYTGPSSKTLLGAAAKMTVPEIRGLVGANLVGANLVGANLDGANLVGASLDGASLVGANLDGANLVGASLVGASLDGASLVGASLVGANLVGANLDGANLDGANLDGANLVGASLVGANLVGASLVGASLVGANLDGASLVGANLDGANLDGANLGERMPVRLRP